MLHIDFIEITRNVNTCIFVQLKAKVQLDVIVRHTLELKSCIGLILIMCETEITRTLQ